MKSWQIRIDNQERQERSAVREAWAQPEDWETQKNGFELVIEMDQLLNKQKRNILSILVHFTGYFELQMQAADLREHF